MSSLDDALRGVERVLLDTSTLLAFHSHHEAAHSLATHLFREFRWVYLGDHHPPDSAPL